MANEIYVKGANENNLKHVDVKIPRDQLVVLTGLSGSGKSSLAFDTIMPKGRDDMWRVCPLMRGSSWARWTSRMWS